MLQNAAYFVPFSQVQFFSSVKKSSNLLGIKFPSFADIYFNYYSLSQIYAPSSILQRITDPKRPYSSTATALARKNPSPNI